MDTQTILGQLRLAVELTYGRNLAQYQKILTYLAILSLLVWTLVLASTLYRSFVIRQRKGRRGAGVHKKP